MVADEASGQAAGGAGDPGNTATATKPDGAVTKTGSPPGYAGSTKAPEGVGAAASAFMSAFSAATKTTTEPAPDPDVPVAFALGWQMQELYRPDQWRTRPPRRDDDLPGLSEFSAAQRAGIGLDQVDVALNRLHDSITKGGLEAPTTAAARKALGGDPTSEAFRGELFDLHIELLSTLTAANFKLGKAYGLGRALADTCRKPNDLASVKDELESHRIATLKAWIADLTSAFPAHAGHSVGASLSRWTEWATGPNLPGSDDPARVVRLLRRQGERWRALLSGEKAGTDLLELQDYVSAGAGMLKRFSSLTWRFLWRFLPAVILAVVLFAGGVWLILSHEHSGNIAAGAAGMLASLGLTWKGVGSSLGKAAAKLEPPVWEAELDAAITTALTLLPDSKRTKNYIPPLTSVERAKQLDQTPTDN